MLTKTTVLPTSLTQVVKEFGGVTDCDSYSSSTDNSFIDSNSVAVYKLNQLQ